MGMDMGNVATVGERLLLCGLQVDRPSAPHRPLPRFLAHFLSPCCDGRPLPFSPPPLHPPPRRIIFVRHVRSVLCLWMCVLGTAFASTPSPSSAAARGGPETCLFFFVSVTVNAVQRVVLDVYALRWWEVCASAGPRPHRFAFLPLLTILCRTFVVMRVWERERERRPHSSVNCVSHGRP
eukprot:RCo052902